VKALFNFDKVQAIADESFEDKVKEGENLKLQYYDGALKIFAAYFGKTVTMDGSVYYAQEISIHTPSEHTIDGEQFPMELQVKHVGKSLGDTSKHLILSFVFKKSPGIYNKFLETLDFFNLPSPLDKVRDIEKALFLPNIFFQVNEDGKLSFLQFRTKQHDSIQLLYL
jgi:carbonic anhydrase